MKHVFSFILFLITGFTYSQNPALVLYERNWYDINNIEKVDCTTLTIIGEDTTLSYGPNFQYKAKDELLVKQYIDSNGRILKNLNQYYLINNCDMPLEVSKNKKDTIIYIPCTPITGTTNTGYGIKKRYNENGQLIQKWVDSTQAGFFSEVFTYNALGKIKAIKRISKNVNSSSDYFYEEEGKLVKIVVKSTREFVEEVSETYFLYNTNKVEIKTIITKKPL